MMSSYGKEGTQMKIYAGIDVAKKTFDLNIHGQKEVFHFDYNDAGIQHCIKRLTENKVERVAMEATGGYERDLAVALHTEGLVVTIVNPKRIRDFSKSMGKLAKTDRIDAMMISAFASTCPLPKSTVIDANAYRLKALVARRNQLIALRTCENNRKEHIADQVIARSIDTILGVFEKEIGLIDQEISDHIDGQPELKERTTIMESVPGIGTTTASMLVSEVPELGICNKREIAALIGVAPINRDSGQFRGKRMTGGGRVHVRSRLFMPTLVTIRYNPKLKAFYQRLLAKGKSKMTAIVAVMRKLLVILNTMIKKNQLWNEHLA